MKNFLNANELLGMKCKFFVGSDAIFSLVILQKQSKMQAFCSDK